MVLNPSRSEIELPTKEGFITVAGSRSYGTNTPDSDYDYRGFYFPDPKYVLGLRAGPESRNFIKDGNDVAFWELRHFARLCLNANPNVLEALFTDPVDHMLVTPAAKFILDNKQLFLSRKIADSFVGVAISNSKKIEKSIIRGDPYLGKDAMHLIRYLGTCYDALRTGELKIKRSPFECRTLLQIRNKELNLEYVMNEKNELLERIDEIRDNSVLPEKPDEEAVNRIIIDEMFSYLELHED